MTQWRQLRQVKCAGGETILGRYDSMRDEYRNDQNRRFSVTQSVQLELLFLPLFGNSPMGVGLP
jgi:hypothetical protein